MSFQYQLSHNGTSQNFFKTRTMMNEEGNKYMEVYSYYDGLGRPYQTVECKNNSIPNSFNHFTRI